MVRSARRGGAIDRRVTTRWSELRLILCASVITCAGWWAVDETAVGRMSSSAPALLAGFVGLWLVAHGCLCCTAPKADQLLVPCSVLLSGLGLVMIHRIDLAQAQGFGAQASVDAPKQLVWLAVAVAALVAVLLVARDPTSLARYSYTAGFLGVVLIVAPALLPASVSEINGAKLWLRVGGLSIQPGEFAKLALTVFFAAYLIEKRDLLAGAGRRIGGLQLPRGRDLGPVLTVWALSVLILVSQKDLGMGFLLFGIFLACLYVATQRLSWVLIGLALFSVVAVGAFYALARIHTRVAVWLDPFAYPDTGYQMRQSLFSLGTGGLFGTGLGGGHPNLVPLARTDFIIAAFGEETGLAGLTVIVLIYAILVSRMLRIAQLARDRFSKLLTAGLAITIGLQVFVIVAGVTNLLPETGLATPLLSYGGSALVANLILIGIAVRVSNENDLPGTIPAAPAGSTVEAGHRPP